MAEYQVLNASKMKEIADNKKNEEKKKYDVKQYCLRRPTHMGR